MKNNLLAIMLVVIVFVVGLVTGMVVIEQDFIDVSDTIIGNSDKTDVKDESIETKLGKLIFLNPNEEASVATLVDIESLKETNPEFYKDAEVDDKLIVFSDKAIIYRESEDLIINVVPISSNSEI